MKKKMVSVLLTASMLAGMTLCAVPVMAEDAETPENEVTGDASADDSFVVWGWNDDIKKILDGPFKEAYPDDYERIVFVNTGGSDYRRHQNACHDGHRASGKNKGGTHFRRLFYHPQRLQ